MISDKNFPDLSAGLVMYLANDLCLKILPDNVFSAALGSFKLKRSIPLHTYADGTFM